MNKQVFIVLSMVLIITVISGVSFSHGEYFPPEIRLSTGITEVSCPGCNTGYPGDPNLPYRILNYALPENSEAVSIDFSVECETLITDVVIQKISLDEYEIPWDSYINSQHFIDYNTPIAVLIGTRYLHNVPIAQIKFYPVNYYHKNGALIWNKKIDFNFLVQQSDRTTHNRVVTPISAQIQESTLESAVENFDEIDFSPDIIDCSIMESHTRSFPPSAGDDPCDGIIITSLEYERFLTPLLDEIDFGVVLEIIPFSEIYSQYISGVDRAERLSRFIKDAYNFWGISGVFLVGKLDEIPIRYRYGQNAVSNHVYVPTDLYYSVFDNNWNSDMDYYFGEELEDDFLPELFTGRFQTEDTTELIAYVDKIKSHRWETASMRTSKWLFACASLSPHDFMGQTICDSIIDDYSGEDRIEPIKMYTYADSTSGDWEFNETNFNAQIDTGVYVICHIDHGYQYVLHTSKETTGGSGLDIGEFIALDNSPNYPLLFSYSCEVNALDFNTVGMASVRSPEGGTIATIANSRSAWTPQIYFVFNFWESFLDAKYSIKIGEILQHTILSYPDDVISRYYKSIITLFGYPFLDMMIGSGVDATMAISPSTITSSDSLLEISITDSISGDPLDSVLIVARTNSGKYAMTRTDIGGTADIYIHPSGESSIIVTASGGGIIPISDTISIISGSNPALSIEDFSFYEISGDADLIPEPGDTWSCNLKLYNSGGSTSGPVEIISQCEYIIDSILTISSIAPGESLTVDTAFSFSISPSLRGYENLRPIINLGFGEFITVDTLSLQIMGPELIHYLTEYDDSIDGVPDSGETANLNIHLFNRGLGDFYDCELDIELWGATTTTSHLTIGDILSGDTLNASIPLFTTNNAISSEIILSSSNSTSETLNIKINSPARPDSLEMIPALHSIELFWEYPEDSTIIGFNIYRADSLLTYWELMNQYPVSSAIYLDENLPECCSYYYRVTSVDRWSNESNPSDSLKAWTTLPFHEPWPKSVGPSIRLYASPILYDMDFDGSQEIYFPGQNYGAIFAFYGDGLDLNDTTMGIDPFVVTAYEGGFPVENGIWGSPAMGDLDNDGDFELVTNHRHNSKTLHAWDIRDGSSEPGWPVSVGVSSMGNVILADLDNDSLLEIINPTFTGLEFFEEDGSVYTPCTSIVFSELEEHMTGTLYGSPAVGDIDSDGNLDIIYGGPWDSLGFGTIWAFENDGTIKDGWPLRLHGMNALPASFTLANFDSDTNTLEILAATRGTGAIILNYMGEILSGWPKPEYFFPMYFSHCAAVDFDGDGICEAVIPGSYKLAIIRADGTLLDGWPQIIGNSTEFPSNPTVGDIDGDGEWEILCTWKDRVFGFDVDGQQLPGYPLVIEDICYNEPSLGDIDGDGLIEIVIGAFDSRIYIWETVSAFNEEAIAWPTDRNNYRRTGVYGEHMGTSITENKLPRELEMKIYPNPFNSSCKIEFSGNLELQIFDLNGHLVRDFNNEQSKRYVLWDGLDNSGSKLPSGVYLLRIKNSMQTTNQKIVLIR